MTVISKYKCVSNFQTLQIFHLHNKKDSRQQEKKPGRQKKESSEKSNFEEDCYFANIAAEKLQRTIMIAMIMNRRQIIMLSYFIIFVFSLH